MQTKTKILFLAAMAFAFCYAGNAKADYWTEKTTANSNNVIPAYFEAETMAKSSNGVRLIYGIERIPGNSCPADCPRHVLSFDGTNWIDESADIKIASGLTDFEFENMSSDSGGNIWMSNRNPGKLLKFDGTNWTLVNVQDIVDDVFAGETLSASFIYSVFQDSTNNRLYVFADIQTDARHDLFLVYLDQTNNVWHKVNVTGGPMDNSLYTTDGGQLFGVFSNARNEIWAWKWRSSDTSTSLGLYKLDMSSLTWTQYSTSNGMTGNTGDHINDVFCDTNGNVWAATRYGVFKYSGGSWTQLTKETDQITSNRVHKIQEDSDARVWIVGLNEADIGDMTTKGGISIYDSSAASWEYYTARNGEDVINDATNVFIFQDEVWLQSGHGDDAASGIYILTRDDAHTALYGQVSGTTVAKAGFDQQRSSSAKKVTITKKYKVKKKWKKKVVYRGKSTDGWYKKLNLVAGTNIKYIIKVQGKRARTVNASDGDPIKVSVN